jgi:hypothetical protein
MASGDDTRFSLPLGSSFDIVHATTQSRQAARQAERRPEPAQPARPVPAQSAQAAAAKPRPAPAESEAHRAADQLRRTEQAQLLAVAPLTPKPQVSQAQAAQPAQSQPAQRQAAQPQATQAQAVQSQAPQPRATQARATQPAPAAPPRLTRRASVVTAALSRRPSGPAIMRDPFGAPSLAMVR